jgi:hypothetical protein
MNSWGTIEIAQRIAGHTSPTTTRIYDRSGDRLTLEEMSADREETRDLNFALDADYLDGSKTDRLVFPRFPANISVKTFWSLIPYDTQTRSVLRSCGPISGIQAAVRILVSVGSDIPDHVG